MKNLIYAVYRVSPKVLRQFLRSVISFIRTLSGQSNTEYHVYENDRKSAEIPLYDTNIDTIGPLNCQICGSNRVISPYADLVRVQPDVAVRKKFHMCQGCGFLFTNEKRMDREDYFENTPYLEDKEGLRSGREVDLIELLAGIDGFDMDSNILVYAIGKGNTLKLLHEKGYSNAWGADVSDGVDYGERIINISNQSDYFLRNNIRFDIITSVEVWEHYAQSEIDDAFAWQFEQLSDNGALIGTTSLWASGAGNEYFKGKYESGIHFLKLWHYPFFIDHTSMYTEEALTIVSGKYGMNVDFAYFDKPYVHIMDPGKRIVLMTKKSNLDLSGYFSQNYSRRFLPVSH